MRIKQALISFAVFISLTGCATSQQAHVTRGNTEAGETTLKATKDYAFCVWTAADKMRGGSPDVRLVVDTAMDLCKTYHHQFYKALAIDQLDPSFAEGYYNATINQIRTLAARRILEGNARAATREQQ